MEFYLDTLSITQLKSLLPSVFEIVILKKISEKQRELEGKGNLWEESQRQK